MHGDERLLLKLKESLLIKHDKLISNKNISPAFNTFHLTRSKFDYITLLIYWLNFTG